MNECKTCRWLEFNEKDGKSRCILISTFESDEKKTGLRDEKGELIDKENLIIPDPEIFGCKRHKDKEVI